MISENNNDSKVNKGKILYFVILIIIIIKLLIFEILKLIYGHQAILISLNYLEKNKCKSIYNFDISLFWFTRPIILITIIYVK